MKTIDINENLVSKCGLYCGACRAFLNEKCPGCAENIKAGWCKVRSCCLEHSFATCADCKEFGDVNDCGKFNYFISKIFAFVFKSDRRAGIEFIKQKGRHAFAEHLATVKHHTIKRK